MSIENKEVLEGRLLPVMESFYTVQGEGYYQGKAAYFVRLGGCDVGCHWCDVKESWDAEAHPLVRVEDIAEQAAAYPSKIVVVTGGEPLMYNLKPLTDALHAKGLRSHIETSGAHPVSGDWDWICFSPKKFKDPLPEIFPLTNELKVIVFNKSDFSWAEGFASEINPQSKLYLQPEWSKQKQMLPLIVEYVKNNPQWEISLQIHKYMDIP